MTSSPLVRFALALALALAAAPFAAGCATAPSSSVRPGELVAGAAPATAAPPVRAEARLDNGIQVVDRGEPRRAAGRDPGLGRRRARPTIRPRWRGRRTSSSTSSCAAASGAARASGVREIEAVKGSVGAWTGLDETVYHAVVAAPFFELGLDVLADAIANPNFDPAEIEQARKLALDEIAGAAADPRQRASQALFAGAFAGDRHARPVHGDGGFGRRAGAGGAGGALRGDARRGGDDGRDRR